MNKINVLVYSSFFKNQRIRNVIKRQNGYQTTNPGMQRSNIFHTSKTLDVDNADGGDEIIDDELDLLELNKQKTYEKEINTMHRKIQKLIVKQQMGEENEPTFITFAEKEQIKFLYNTDSKRYSLEVLSASFPVLPETIKKIIKTTWVPRSVEDIVRYDNMVLQNWEKYYAGSLALDIKMSNHLQRFKRNKIMLINNEVIHKLIAPKNKFLKPHSTLFSRLLKCIELEDFTSTEQLNSELNEDVNFPITPSTISQNVDLEVRNNFSNILRKNNFIYNIPRKKQQNQLKLFKYENESQKLKYVGRRMMLDNFLSNSIYNSASDSSSPETVVMKGMYQSLRSQTNEGSIQTVPISTDNKLKCQKVEKEPVSKPVTTVREETKTKVQIENQKFNNYLSKQFGMMAETGVIEWIRREEDIQMASCIKIPKHRFKKGMTYRVKDCFYDDDGLFLYRVPGLKY